jgi:gliding motility-associated-like protein/uncharacterized repeat protein (TIGR01451 family)
MFWNLKIENAGPSFAENVTIDLNFPASFTSIEYSPDGGASWRIAPAFIEYGKIYDGRMINLAFRAYLNSNTTGVLSFSASVTANDNDLTPTNNFVQFSGAVVSKADLSITKSQVYPFPSKGEQVAYSIGLRNHGPSDAFAVVLVDTIYPSIIENAIYSVGYEWANWHDTLTIPLIKAGEELVCQIKGIVSASSPDTLLNTAYISSGSIDSNPLNNQSTVRTILDRYVDLSIAVDGSDTLVAGENIFWNLKVINHSLFDSVSNVLIEPVWDRRHFEFLEYKLEGTENWETLSHLIEVSELKKSDTVHFIIRSKILSGVDDSVSIHFKIISSDLTDYNQDNNSTTKKTIIHSEADLRVMNMVVFPLIAAGGEIEYNVAFENIGKSDAKNVRLFFNFPGIVSQALYSFDGNSYTTFDGEVVIGTVLSQGSGFVFIKGLVDEKFEGALETIATIQGQTSELNLENNTSVSSVDIVKNCDLYVRLRLEQNPAFIGKDLTYYVDVNNNGPSVAKDVNIGGLLIPAFSSPQFSVDGGLSWNNWFGTYMLDSLNVGSPFSLRIKYKIVSPSLDRTVVSNSVNVYSSANDVNLDNNDATTTVTVRSMADIGVIAETELLNPDKGNQVAIQLKAYNNGFSPVSGIPVNALLPDGYSYVSHAGAGNYNPTTGIWLPGNLSTGDTLKLTIYATVKESGKYTFPLSFSPSFYDPVLSNNTFILNINPDKEAQWDIAIPRNIDSFSNGDLLASVTDEDGAVVTAIVANSIFPDGLQLNEVNGTIRVSDKTLLKSGIHAFSVKTVDAKAGESVTLLKIELLPDTEAVYTVASARNVDDYATGEVLAHAFDFDGLIVSAQLSSGSLPNGLQLNANNGQISISNASILQGGNHLIEISTTDIAGGKTTQFVPLQITPDIEAAYIISNSKLLEEYIAGDTLAILTDADGKILSANITSGSLPAGWAMDNRSGLLTVANPASLTTGLFRFTVRSVDETFGITSQIVTIVLNPDIESVYTLATPRNVDSYVDGEILATVTDGNGEIVNTVILSGNLPQGVFLNQVNGTISVADASLLRSGTYKITVNTYDVGDGLTTHVLELIFLHDNEAVYSILPPQNLFSYSKGQTLAEVSDADGVITSAQVVNSSLPPGIAIDVVNGRISVSDKSQLLPGIHRFNVLTNDAKGGKTISEVLLHFLAVDLVINKQAHSDYVVAGEIIVYTISVKNEGPSLAKEVIVNETFPVGFSDITVNVDKGNWDFPRWYVGDIFPGETVSMVLEATVSSEIRGEIENKVVVESQTSELDVSTNVSISVVDVVDQADLEVHITGLPSPVVSGDKVYYVIDLKNNGPSNAQQVVLSYPFPDGLFFHSLSTPKGISSNNSLAIDELLADEEIRIVLVANVDATLLQNVVIENSITVHSATFDVDLNNNSDSEMLTLLNSADLSAVITTSNGVVAGEQVNYFISVMNSGPSIAKNVEITHSFDSQLSDIEFSIDMGQNWSILTDKIAAGDLLPGEFFLGMVRGKLASAASGNIISSIVVNSNSSDPNILNNSSVVATPVVLSQNLSVFKTGPATVLAGSELLYQIAISNGNTNSNNVIFRDVIPAGYTNVRYSRDFGNSWIAWPASNQLSLGNMSAGKVEVLMLYGTVSSGSTGMLTNTATVTTTSTDPDLQNNTSSVQVEIIRHSDLAIRKTDRLEEFVPGLEVEYFITVLNNGPHDAFDARVTDFAPDGVVFSRWTAEGTAGAVFPVSGSGDIDHLLSLPVGGMVFYSVNAYVQPSFRGALVNTASVNTTGSSIDPVLDNNSSTDLNRPNAKATLEIVMSCSSNEVVAGELATYTLTVTNKGPSDAYNILVENIFGEYFSFVSASDNPSLTGNKVNWTLESLSDGSSKTITLTLRVKSNTPSGLVLSNQATVISDNSIARVESLPCSILVSLFSLLEITNQPQKTSVNAGENITYTIQIKNNGPSDAYHLRISNSLPEGCSFLNASEGGYLLDGVIGWEKEKLPADSIYELTFTCKVASMVKPATIIWNATLVNSDYSGDPIMSNRSSLVVTNLSTLTLNKTAPMYAISGENFEYSLTISNNGPSDAFGVKLFDLLSPNLEFVSSTGGGVFDAGRVTWDIPVLEANSQVEITFTVKSFLSVSEGAVVKNIAYLTRDNSADIVYSNETATTISRFILRANDDKGDPILGAFGGVAVKTVLENDVIDNNPVAPTQVVLSLISTDHENIKLNNSTGEVYVDRATSAGVYVLTYRICLSDFPQFCDEAKVSVTVLPSEIIAVTDVPSPVNNVEGGIAIQNVLDNDKLNGAPIRIEEVILLFSKETMVDGIFLDEDSGRITVSPGTPQGVYSFVYSICEKLNPLNCSETTVKIEVIDDCDLFVPTGFSPNNDGVHDYFKIKCVEKYPNAAIEIFNRWGNVVFRMENYGNRFVWGETDAWWDGKSNNTLNIGSGMLPTGTYFYILHLNSENEKPVIGSFFLSR